MVSRSEKVFSRRALEAKEKVIEKLGLMSQETTQLESSFYEVRNHTKLIIRYSARDFGDNHASYSFTFHERMLYRCSGVTFFLLICGGEAQVFVLPGDLVKDRLMRRSWGAVSGREILITERGERYHVTIDGISIPNPVQYLNSYSMVRAAVLNHTQEEAKIRTDVPAVSESGSSGTVPVSVTETPWLDGIIWGAGSNDDNHSVRLQLNEVPVSMIEEMARAYQTAGFDVEYADGDESSGIPGRSLTISREDGFDTRVLSGSQRRLDLLTPADFVNGYIVTRLYTVLKKADTTAARNDLISRLGLRLRCNEGELDSIIKAMSDRGFTCHVVHDGSIEIPAELYDKEPFSEFMQALRDEYVTDGQRSRSTGKTEITRSRMPTRHRDLHSIIPPPVIVHLAGKAKFNSKLSGRDRSALFSIGRSMMFGRPISDKQINLINLVLERALKAELQSDSCDRGRDCPLCRQLRETVSSKLE